MSCCNRGGGSSESAVKVESPVLSCWPAWESDVLMPIASRLSTLICSLAVVWTASIGHATADHKFELCGIDESTFQSLAFSGLAGPNFEQRIVKWASPPRLAVLSGVRSPTIEEKVKAVERTVEHYMAADGITTQFLYYSDYAQAAAIAKSMDQNTVVVFIDGPVFEKSEPVSEQFLQILTSILKSPEIAQTLTSSVHAAYRQSATQMTIDLRTGEIVAAASLIDAKSDLHEIASSVFLAYFTALSPSFSANVDATKALFSGKGWEIKLTRTGEAYFAVISNDRVKIGTPEESFISCSTSN